MTIRTMSLLLLVAGGLLLVGCDSDSTAPNDAAPPLEPAGAAAQAGFMARMMTEMAPLDLFNYAGKDTDPTYEFLPPSDLTGTVLLSYRIGTTPAEPGNATSCWGRTDPENPLQLVMSESTHVSYQLTFDMTADEFVRNLDVSNDVDRLTLNSNRPGTFRAGTYVASWTVTDLVIDTNHYPDGEVVFTVEGYACTVTFDGDRYATITVADESFTVDLDEGLIIND
jgi:hypothetical protein